MHPFGKHRKKSPDEGPTRKPELGHEKPYTFVRGLWRCLNERSEEERERVATLNCSSDFSHIQIVGEVNRLGTDF